MTPIIIKIQTLQLKASALNTFGFTIKLLELI